MEPSPRAADPPAPPGELAGDLVRRALADLRGNILPFWIEHAPDRQVGGFVGSLTDELAPDPAAERGALLASRILWTYAAAWARFPQPELRRMADYAYRTLLDRFHDPAHGGFWWSVDASGALRDGRKQVYGQAFAIFALSEYAAATGSAEAAGRARELFGLLEARARDRRYGGYFEAFDRAWEPVTDHRLSSVDLNEPKSQNTHLHLLEAYLNLLRVAPAEEVRAALGHVLEILLERILDPATGHLGLFFAEDWTRRSDQVSYGHDIEAAWLMTRAAQALGEPQRRARVEGLAVRIAEITLAEGVDEDGGLFNGGGPSGPTDTNKEWWPQAEAVVGFANAFQLSGGGHFLRAAARSWDFIERRLIDRRWGEWIRGVDRAGRPLAGQAKVGFWKCPYHNGRAALELAARLGGAASPAQR